MPTLEITVLGKAQVHLNGAPIHWQSAGALELFYFLLAHPEGCSKTDILASVWDEEVTPATSNRFRVNLHRLRAALGDPESVQESAGRYHLSQAVLASSDVYTLHHTLSQADHLQAPAERRGLLERALSLYGGDFLPDLRADWADQARAEHRAAYVRGALELSLLCCDEAQCDAAVAALARALKADPYLGENYHQDLMTCLTVVEQKYQAVEHYRDFLRLLREDLGDTPMLETLHLFERIKAGQPLCPHHIGGGAPCSRHGEAGGCVPLTLSSDTPDLDELRGDLERSHILLSLSHALLPIEGFAQSAAVLREALEPRLEATLEVLRLGHPLLPEQAVVRGILEEMMHSERGLYLADSTLHPSLGAHLPPAAYALEPVPAASGRPQAALLLTRPVSGGVWSASERHLLEGAARTLGLALERIGVA